MVASAERLADLRERRLRQFARKEHRDLPRERDVCRAALAGHVGNAHVVEFGDLVLDLVDRDDATRLLLQDVLEQMFDGLGIQLPPAERCERRNAHQRAFEPPHVGADIFRKKFDHAVVEFHLQGLHFFAKNRVARLGVRWLQFRRESPLEARHQPLFEIRDLGRRTIARKDNLPVAVGKRVERVEKFLL